MNRTWSVVLIIVACLLVLSGTYWYVVVRDKPSQSAVVQPEEPKTQVPEAVGSTPIPEQSEPEVEETKPTTPATSTEEVIEAVDISKALELVEVVIEQPTQKMLPLSPPVDPLIAQGILRLPKQDAVSVDIPFAPPATEKKDAIAESEPILQEIPMVAAEEPAPSGEAPLEEQEEKQGAEEVKETITLVPSSPVAPAIPTSRVEFDPQPLSWSIGTSVSFIDYQWPDAYKGFDVQLDVLKHTDSLFQFGGTMEYARVNSQSQISVLAKAQWIFRSDKTISLPVSISLGPTFFLGTSSGLGLTAKVQGGFSYALTDFLRFFYQAGIQAQWAITDAKFTVALEPMRIGFSFSL